MIVCDDADFALTLPAAGAVCMHAGQGCALQSRVLLPRSRYAEGVEILTQVMSSIPYGDPRDPAVLSGPLISALQRDRVQAHLDRAVAHGARLVVGGARPAHLPKGYYIQPTLFADVDNSMAIAQEEVFGPVLAAIAYSGDDDAVRIANDSRYGLSGGVFSASPERAMAVANRVRTGSIGVNGGLWYGADAPYGGYKTSGLGRQNGAEGFEQYTETKVVGWLG
jgi:aldehyde dehydrogenase (NAD+)